MSFTTEDPDTVNAVLAEIRQQVKDGAFRKEKPYNIKFNTGEAYRPTNPNASNHPVDDYKWEDRYDHPKD